MAEGINPNEVKRQQRAAGVTLQACFDSYLSDRSLAVNTISNYRTVLDSHLSSWKMKPMKRITRDMVEARHRELSKTSPTAANKSMRVLRSLFNYASGKYSDGLFTDNPVQRLTHTRAWNREGRRDNTIKRTQLVSWFEAVRACESQAVSDYLQFVLLTGLRRREATSLRVSDVDFNERAFTVYVTKNRQPLSLPMSDYTEVLLGEQCAISEGEFVFSGVSDPRRQLATLRKEVGFEFTIHDLRRTFITLAESLDISAFALKRLVNHSAGGDVTAGYVRMDVERLRKPTQEICDYILSLAGIREKPEIVSISDRVAPSEIVQ